MAERRYSEDEVAAIFELASKTDVSGLPASAGGTGLTLPALQEIGREIGISPEAISLAAQSLSPAARLPAPSYLGLPVGVGRIVEFERKLSDAEWENLVAELRTTFQARGVVRYDGPFRQWTNGNLTALLEPTREGHRLRMMTVRGASRARMMAGSLVMAGAGATLLAQAMAGGLSHLGNFVGPGFIALVGAGLFALGALPVTGWARRRGEQFDAVIARLREAMRAK